jgi:hypothetical protein
MIELRLLKDIPSPTIEAKTSEGLPSEERISVN